MASAVQFNASGMETAWAADAKPSIRISSVQFGPRKPAIAALSDRDAMNKSAAQLVLQTMSSLEDIEVPQVLRDNITQHQSHLLSLASALLKGGQNEKEVKRIVDQVFGSYKLELVQTIMALRGNVNAH